MTKQQALHRMQAIAQCDARRDAARALYAGEYAAAVAKYPAEIKPTLDKSDVGYAAAWVKYHARRDATWVKYNAAITAARYKYNAEIEAAWSKYYAE